MSRGALHIFFGTTGGNSERFAADLIDEAGAQQYNPQLVHLADYDPEEFLKVKRVIFVVSTYGVGGPTNDAKKFNAWF